MPNQQAYRLGRTLTVITFVTAIVVDVSSVWYLALGFLALAVTALCLVWKGSAE